MTRTLRYLFWSLAFEVTDWLYRDGMPLMTYLYLVEKLSDATDWGDARECGGEEPF